MNIDGSTGNKNQNPIITRPYDFGTDAIERTRVSLGQSLIDADFEYGLQATKWQTFSDIRKIPSFFDIPGTDYVISSISSSGSTPSVITIIASTQSGAPSAGQAISVQGLASSDGLYDRAQGFFVLNTVSGSNPYTMTYTAKGTITSGSLLTTFSTIRKGGFYVGSSATSGNTAMAWTSVSAASGNVTVNTSNVHGLLPGTPLSLIGWTGGGTSINGSTIVQTISNITSFSVSVSGASGAYTAGNVYVQTYASFQHRPFDGGVIISPIINAYGASAIRQSKKVFRYQSGKGLLWSSGTLFCPNNDITSISASGTAIGSTITITTSISHGAPQLGATILIKGIASQGYNGTYTVTGVISSFILTVTANQTLSTTNPVFSDQPRFVMVGWHGSSCRVGCFDDQNGLFWEWDGQTLWAVKRSSTFQLMGTGSIPQNSQTLTGTGSRYADQLKMNDRITIRGMTYVVTSITTQSQISINPPYRGVGGATNVQVCKIKEQRTPQNGFNRDSIDGNGLSGFKFEPSKMQMVGIQYTWYGAGFIDFMMRGSDGNWVYAHRYKQNNVNDEAYMRSGNLPVRYELVNETSHAVSTLAATIGPSDMSFTINDEALYWPSSGTVLIDNELINYTSKSGKTFTVNPSSGRSAVLNYNMIDTPYTLNCGAASPHNGGTSSNTLSGLTSISLNSSVNTLTPISSVQVINQTVSAIASVTSSGGTVTFNGGLGLPTAIGIQVSISDFVPSSINGTYFVNSYSTGLSFGIPFPSSYTATTIGTATYSYMILNYSSNPSYNGIIQPFTQVTISGFGPTNTGSIVNGTYTAQKASSSVQLVVFLPSNTPLSGTVTGASGTVTSIPSTLITFPFQSTVLYSVGSVVNLSGFSPTTTSTGASVNSQYTVLGCGLNYVSLSSISGTYTASSLGTISVFAATVLLVSTTCTPSLTHWGSALIMDGLFDQDRGYLFNFQTNQFNLSATSTIQAGTSNNICLLRLSPSVSNGVIGDIGARDLLNRAQLLLQRLDVWTSNATGIGSTIISGILNPSFSISNFTVSSNWVAINSAVNGSQPSFAQVYTGTPLYNLGTYVQGSGERVFSTICNSGTQYSIDLSGLKEICNGTNGGNNFFPDGPDTLLIQISVPANAPSINNYSLNLFWSEAQA